MKDKIKLLLFIIILLIVSSAVCSVFSFLAISIFILTCTTIYITFIYVCHIHDKLKNGKNPTINYDKDYNPLVSILIPCHNEECVIEATVKNVLELDYDNYEIVLIDDRSVDKTPEIIKQLSENNEKIQYLIRDNDAFPGKSAALNDAMNIAKGEAILVLDADAKIKPNFVKKLLVKFQADDIGAVQAKKVIVNRTQNLLTRCQYNQYIFDCFIQSGRDVIKGAVELRGNGEMIKRAAIEDISGWNNETITDDLDLSTKLHVYGWNIRFAPNVEVYEEGILEYPALLKQGRRWVEGGIRRFLTYTRKFLFLGKISFRVAMDLISYISLFMTPFWLIAAIIFAMINGDVNIKMYLLSALLMIICSGILFAGSLWWALKKYSDTSEWHPIKDICITTLYIVAFWLPLTIFVFFKIIFMPKTMTWNKTVHGVTENN